MAKESSPKRLFANRDDHLASVERSLKAAAKTLEEGKREIERARGLLSPVSKAPPGLSRRPDR